MITGKNYIGNVLASTGKVTFKTFNPQTNLDNDVIFTEVSPTILLSNTLKNENSLNISRLIDGKQTTKKNLKI